MNPVKKQASDD